MNNQFKKLALLVALAVGVVSSCKKDDSSHQAEKPFVISEYYIAGTITPKSGSYTSVYLIKLLEDNKAVFVGTGNDLRGEYSLTKDSLIVTIPDPNNYRTARFAINSEHQLTSSYYRALTTEYGSTGNLLKIEENNQLAGKVFKGEEFKMGPVSFRKDLNYKFNGSGLTLGSGIDLNAIDDEGITYELINNSAFKYKSGSTTEIGFLSNNQLTVFRSSGLFYYGRYAQQ